MSQHISEAEQCVDQLLGNLPRLNELIARFEDTNSDILPETIEESKILAQDVSKFIEDNHITHQIPPYVIEKVQNSVFKLQKLVSDKDLSKFKFSFKTGSMKPTAPKVTTTTPVDVKPDKDEEDKSRLEICHNGIKIENKRDETIVLTGRNVDKQDVTLIDLKNCDVFIIGKGETIYMKELDNTTVTICLAIRAVTVRNCKDCRFKIVCQQLRIDETYRSTFETFIKTRAMLESSKDLQFTPLDVDQMSSQLSRHVPSDQPVKVLIHSMGFEQNNWKCIDDFDWLSPDCPSKNYKLI